MLAYEIPQKPVAGPSCRRLGLEWLRTPGAATGCGSVWFGWECLLKSSTPAPTSFRSPPCLSLPSHDPPLNPHLSTSPLSPPSAPEPKPPRQPYSTSPYPSTPPTSTPQLAPAPDTLQTHESVRASGAWLSATENPSCMQGTLAREQEEEVRLGFRHNTLCCFRSSEAMDVRFSVPAGILSDCLRKPSACNFASSTQLCPETQTLTVTSDPKAQTGLNRII